MCCFRTMSSCRKQYQKLWTAKKRKAIRLCKNAEVTEETSESSDSSETNSIDVLALETQNMI